MAYNGPLPQVVKAGGTGLSTAGTSGTLLQSNGTTFTNTTATYPGTAGTSGKVLISDGTNIVSSTPTFPNASATSGKFIRSDGTNWIASTPTLPTTAGTTSTILRSDGTNFVNSTATYPDSTTANQILYSSANNTITGLATANSAVLATNGSGVPSITATPTVTSITFGSGNALNTYVEKTSFTPTIKGSTSAGTTTYSQQVGVYAKVGALVHVMIQLTWTAVTGTGNLRIGGLPFTSNATVAACAATGYGGLTLTSGYTELLFETIGNTTDLDSKISGSGKTQASYAIQSSGYIELTLVYST